MPSINEVKLSGYIYNPKETQTASGKTITRFGMKVWCGKGKDGKNIYEFVNCKCFNRLPQVEGEVFFIGRVTVESWEKDGVKHKNVVFIGEVTPKTSETQEDGSDFKDDNIKDIPF